MKWPCLALFVLAAGSWAQAAYAQYDSDNQGVWRGMLSGSAKYVMIPAGTTFEGRIDHTIGSSVSRAGERFVITLSAPLLANGQDVIVPAGSQVIGEVVEAIPSRTLPHQKHTPQPDGKLQTQLTGLRTPDGMTYPLVASLVGEKIETKGGEFTRGGLGSGFGYVGDAQSLSRMQQRQARKNDPNAQLTNENGSGKDVFHRNTTDITRPGAYSAGALAGHDYYQSRQEQEDEARNTKMRSLVRRGHDLFIDGGAPLTVRLRAAVKIALNPNGFQEAMPQVRPNAGPEETALPFETKSPPEGNNAPAHLPPAPKAGANLKQNSNSPGFMPVPGVIQSESTESRSLPNTSEEVIRHKSEETTTRTTPESAF